MEAMFYINDELRKRPVIIYGAGNIGKACLNELKNNNVEVECFCDSAPRKDGTMFQGKMVASPEKLLPMEKYNVIIAIQDYWPVFSILKSKSDQNIFIYRNAFQIDIW